MQPVGSASLPWLTSLSLLPACPPPALPCSSTLVLASEHGSLRAALDALTASPLLSIEVEADEVLFTDVAAGSYTCSRRVGHGCIVWACMPPRGVARAAQAL